MAVTNDLVKSSFWKSIEFCYFPLGSGDLKSYDMQTIYAIMEKNRAVMGVARNLQFCC